MTRSRSSPSSEKTCPAVSWRSTTSMRAPPLTRSFERSSNILRMRKSSLRAARSRRSSSHPTSRGDASSNSASKASTMIPLRNCSPPGGPLSNQRTSLGSSPRPGDTRSPSSSSPRAAHVRAHSSWAGRQARLEAAYHRIESGDLEAAVARLIDVGPAFAESARAGDLEAALLRVPQDSRLDALLAETQMFLGKFADARAVLERIASSGTPSERLRAHIQLGRIANRLAAYQDAWTILAEAVREAAALAVPEVEGEALRALGGVERKLGDLPAAMGHLEQAADLLPHGSRERVRTLTDLGAVLIARGDHLHAKTRLLEAASSVRSGTREDAAIQINLGIVSSREGDARTAAETFARSAEIALGAGDVRFASYALANAVENYLRLEAVEAAATSAERAVQLAQTIGDPVALSTAKANLGLVFAKRGDWPKAEAHLLESVEMIARLENPYSLATRYEEIARLYETQGRGSDAAPWRARADDLFARLQAGGPTPAAGSRTLVLRSQPRSTRDRDKLPQIPAQNGRHTSH